MEEKHSQHMYKSFKFSVLLFYLEGNQTCLLESSDRDIKKLFANAVLESTKKSTKSAGNPSSRENLVMTSAYERTSVRPYVRTSVQTIGEG